MNEYALHALHALHTSCYCADKRADAEGQRCEGKVCQAGTEEGSTSGASALEIAQHREDNFPLQSM